MIIKKLALGIAILSGAIVPAHADYADGMSHYERQEYGQALQQFREAAARGDADAQYMLGRLNEAGNGTLQDFVQAHTWYNLAAARGHRHAAEAREALAKRMTDRQIAEAQQAARDWQPQQTASSQDTSSPPAVETLSYRGRVTEIQRELNRLGYDGGPTDGLMGDRTRHAIAQYQADAGIAQDGRASPELLRHLRQADRDDGNTTAPPEREPRPSQVVLQDDFDDGDYQRNPSWTVISGQFEVDQNGLHNLPDTAWTGNSPGDRPDLDRPEAIGLAVLGMILEQRNGGAAREDTLPPQPARIVVDAPSDNAFRMEVEIASLERSGQVALGLFQGDDPDRTGYRLVYAPGSQAPLRLVRRIAGNPVILARHDGQLDLEDDRFHRIEWSRDQHGEMQVSVDERRLLRVQDNGLRDPFQAFVMETQGGDYSLRRIRIEN
ncbi:MAG: SEL1-like repeat protein [Halothiobacillaceae bacterium]|nr:SEL1-like repeat protein [Halothiobacillaceae bacterium]HER34759.1 hypothetical protein [Halothiobacillaceae bacterium]